MQRLKEFFIILGFILIFSLIWVWDGAIDFRPGYYVKESNVFARAIRFLIWLAVVAGIVYGGILLIMLLLHVVANVGPWLTQPL
jgi:hypothetical protein